MPGVTAEEPPTYDLYAALGVEPTASSEDIRKQYKKRILETHPDKLDPNATEAEKIDAEKEFHKVHQSFQILGDPVERKAYDIRMKISLDPSLVSEEAVEKMKEREEWAEKHRLESERRLSEFKAEVEKEQRARDLLKEKERRELELFDDILKTMYALAPEFSARREAALRRKAEREREEARQRAHFRALPS